MRKAIDELNYHPSHTARGLVSKITGNIGFILTEDHFLRTEPFYTQIFLGSEFEVRKHPYYILLATIAPHAEEDNVLPRFVTENSVDGIIIAGKVPDILLIKLRDYKIPVVLVDYYPPFGDYPAVLIDNLNGGREATEHLISCGHKHIAFIGGDIEHPSIRDRYLGFKMGLDKNNLDYDPATVVITETATSRESGYNAAKALFSKSDNFTAIFACNDAMAIGAMRYIKERGLKIPQEISLIGFDDIEVDLFQNPPVTTMHVPKFDMGGEALRLVCDLIGRESGSVKKILMPVHTVIRGTTC